VRSARSGTLRASGELFIMSLAARSIAKSSIWSV
jgi:hypothetical protein